MILDTIVELRKKDMQQLKNSEYYEKIMNSPIDAPVRDFRGAFTKKQIGIIAEIKKASPSKGIIVENFNVERIAEIYNEIKVDAISVLTEETHFKGSIDNLKIAKMKGTVPILRKDFVVDEFQLIEARVRGADAVLLIAAVLQDKLQTYYLKASELGLHCLIEVHSREELENALQCENGIIGINNRDLNTFNVDIAATKNLMPYIPKDRIVISESGIKDLKDAAELKAIGVRGLLVGESFMRMVYDADKMKAFLNAMKEA